MSKMTTTVMDGTHKQTPTFLQGLPIIIVIIIITNVVVVLVELENELTTHVLSGELNGN